MENTIYIVVLLFCLLIILTFFSKQEPVYYYRCPELPISPITDEIFQKNNIIKSENPNFWDIYLPCGYNGIEKQLTQLELSGRPQAVFGITSCDNIVSKPKLWSILEQTYGRNGAKKIMPESFIVGNPHDLELFKRQYREGDIYILKNWKQRKLGLKLTKDYDYIVRCHPNKFQIVQKYLTNPYLIDGRKINFRVYLLIICHNNLSYFFVNRNLKCIYAQQAFDLSDIKTKERHLTSLNLDPRIYETHPFNRDELTRFWGRDKYRLLMRRMYRSLFYLSVAIQPHICLQAKYHSKVSFQLFGLDYFVDDAFHPWLLEINKGPEMSQTYYKEVEVNNKVMYDTYHMLGLAKLPPNTTNDYDLIWWAGRPGT